MKGLTAKQLEEMFAKLRQKMYIKDIEGNLSPEEKVKGEEMKTKIRSALDRKLEEERVNNSTKRIKNVTEHIDDNKPVMKEISGEEFKAKQDRLRASKKAKTPKLRTKTVAGKGLLGKLGKGLKKGLPALGAIMAGVNILGAPEAQAGEVAMEEATNLVPGGIGKLGAEEGSIDHAMETPSDIDTNTVGMTEELKTKIMNKRRAEAREKRRQALEALRKRSGMK